MTSALSPAASLDQIADDPLSAEVPWRWCAILAAVPAVLAVCQLGRIHPDEVYQYLEPAFFRVHGYGVLAWEWQVGLRNWAFPLIISWLLRTADAVGMRDPWATRAVVELPQWALNAWALAAVFRYARRRVDRTASLFALLLVALTGTVCIYAGRTLGESLSAAFLWVAMEALDRNRPGLRPGLVGGAALGLAVIARYGSAVFVVAALAWLVAGRRWRTLLGCVVAGGILAAALGALDWVTWGAPLHSLIAYVRFNLLSDQAARRFGAMPAGFYAAPLVKLFPLWIGPGLVLALARERPRLSLPLVCGVAYLAVLLFTPHKEARFLYPALALLALAGAPQVARGAVEAGRLRGIAMAAALVASLASFAFGPDVRGDQFRAIVRATRGDAHGLLIVNEGLWGAGGYFYIGRNIPWLTCDWPRDAAFRAAMANPRFDRAVTFEGRALPELEAVGFRPVDRIGRETLLTR